MTAVKQQPAVIEGAFLFSKPMVNAIRENRKTQTRRIIKPQPEPWPLNDAFLRWKSGDPVTLSCLVEQGPYQVGDRLAVKETFYAWGRWITRFNVEKERDEWHFIDLTQSSGKQHLFEEPEGYKAQPRGGVLPTWWKCPAIFMPWSISRLALEITGVRVERLKEISEEDAKAEGAEPMQRVSDDHWFGWHQGEPFPLGYSYQSGFQYIWDIINGKKAPWESNPWVRCYSFKRIEK